MSNHELDPVPCLGPEVQDNEVKDEPPPKSKAFQVNRDIIEAVLPENQPEELRALGIAVYNQSTFEDGILQQVDNALKEQEHKMANLGSKPNENISKKKSAFNRPKENEKEKLIRLGHMTPFGTMLGQENKSNDLTSFEKYLLEQERLKSEKLKNTSKKGKSLKAKSTYNLPLIPPSKQNPAPKSTKKKLSKEEGSDSDYVPDAEEELLINNKPKRRSKAKKRKSDSFDSVSGHSDDSDWEYSASEDEESPKKKKKTNGRVTDDGNLRDFKERVSTWSPHPEFDEYEEFEGGYRIPLAIWDKLFNYQKVSSEKLQVFFVRFNIRISGGCKVDV